ncbi:MAG: phosphate signaling complex protein PhoU [Methanomassiliicoccales archaeon]
MTTRKVFTEELEELNREVTEMADKARRAIELGVEAFIDCDEDIKRKVEDLDEDLYNLEMKIEKHSLDVIALHAPVAKDLRMVSTYLKIITDLNRIGRYALNIAEFTDVMDKKPHFKKLVSIPHMSDVVTSMVDMAVESFTQRDVDEAIELFKKDDEADHLWDSIFRESLTYMIEDPKKITRGTYYILVARYLERIADHACNIGERVVYMVTGERVKQRDLKGKGFRQLKIDQGK